MPPELIGGFRTFTVKLRVSNLPGAVSTLSNIKRRDSALTAVEVAFVRCPKRIVTS